jgi:NAD(P)-dependent dehydrogenase (short-subunit alcohol dehydrogenase family)
MASCAVACLKYDIIEPGGSLTLTSGMAAFKPGKGAAVGGGLNGGVCSLMKGLATELAEKKIRVNTVVPGLVQTELWDKLGKSKAQQKDEFKAAAESLPVGFVATPVHIAEAYLFAVRADYATGTLIQIGMFFHLGASLGQSKYTNDFEMAALHCNLAAQLRYLISIPSKGMNCT